MILTIFSNAQAVESHQHEQLFDTGPIITKESEQAAQELIQRVNNDIALGKYVMRTMNNDVEYIDVGVVIHQTLIDAMKEQLSKDENGKFYENGAQFMVKRIESTFAIYNDILKEQGTPQQLRPVYYGVVNVDTSNPDNQNGLTGRVPDFGIVMDCLYWGDTSGNYLLNKDKCIANNLEQLRSAINPHIDALYYYNEKTNGIAIAGQAQQLSGGVSYDNYRERGRAYGKSTTAESIAFMEQFRFGQENAQVFIHEFGHILGASHQVSEKEPFLGLNNRGYACGTRLNGSPKLPSDYYETRRKTAMHASAAWVTDLHHPFYSDPDRIIEGEACGVLGESENKKVVHEKAAILAKNRTARPITSDVGFTVKDVIANRTEGKATVTFNRTGDLTQPVHLSVIAEDDSAWETRDFEFGLQEIEFLAGQSQTSAEVTLLPIELPHPDRTLRIVVKAALGATYDTEGANILIVSDNPPLQGEMQFSTSSVTSPEGTAIALTVNRVSGADLPATVAVRTINGSALAGLDYTKLETVLQFAAGQTSIEISIPTTNRSGLQGSRSFSIELTAPTNGAVLGTIPITNAVITDVEATSDNGSSSGSGSMGFMSAIGLLALIGLRRKLTLRQK